VQIRARVQDVRGDRASLACEEPPACGTCGVTGGCGFQFAARRASRLLHVEHNGAACPLAAGDVVLVSVADGAIVRAAAATYLFPVVGVLAGAGFAYLAGGGDALAFVAALAGALAAVWYGRRSVTSRFGVIRAGPHTRMADG
jgi:sigma-E factor negative regulatory protein RseC